MLVFWSSKAAYQSHIECQNLVSGGLQSWIPDFGTKALIFFQGPGRPPTKGVSADCFGSNGHLDEPDEEVLAVSQGYTEPLPGFAGAGNGTQSPYGGKASADHGHE